jgi:signal transduction histidine kinase
MEALIDGILAYSRAGRVIKAPETVDTGELVREIIELIATPEGVDVRIADGLPVVSAERLPLEQVFMNLISNALKHGLAFREDVRIDIGCRDLGEAWEFSVADNGPGIAPEYHERIWGMFQTLSPRDHVEGTGVGLAVVQKFVQSRGGSVSLESAPGEGAVFRFTLPESPQTMEGDVP